MGRTALPPGFRFHPTDQELIDFYLKRKVHAQFIELDFIPEVDIYKCEPWDLPEKSFLPGRDLEWYFFSPTDRKYPNGLRTNRATLAGYWKATGKDRKITCHRNIIGTKKTLVFHRGRAPHGCRTCWVMHEYRLQENESPASSRLQDAYALCRVLKKSEPGLSRAEQEVEKIDSPLSVGNLCNDNINMVSGTMQGMPQVTQESDCQTASTTIPSETSSGCVYQSLDDFTSHPLPERTLNNQTFQHGASFSALGFEDLATGLTLSESRMLTRYMEQQNSSNEDAGIVGEIFQHVQATHENNNQIDQYINQDNADILAADYLQLDDLVSGTSFENHERNQNVPPTNGQEECEAFALSYDSLDDSFYGGLNHLDEQSLFFNPFIRKNSDPEVIKHLMDFPFEQYFKGIDATTNGHTFVNHEEGSEKRFLPTNKNQPYNSPDGGGGTNLPGEYSHKIKVHVSHCSASFLPPVTIQKPPEDTHSVKVLDSYCDDVETTQLYSNLSPEIQDDNVEAEIVQSEKGLADKNRRNSSANYKQKKRARMTVSKPFITVVIERLKSWCKGKVIGFLVSKNPAVFSGLGRLAVSAVKVAGPQLIYGQNLKECDINKETQTL